MRVRTELLLDESVVRQRDSFPVQLAKAAFVDQLTHALQVGRPTTHGTSSQPASYDTRHVITTSVLQHTACHHNQRPTTHGMSSQPASYDTRHVITTSVLRHTARHHNQRPTTHGTSSQPASYDTRHLIPTSVL